MDQSEAAAIFFNPQLSLKERKGFVVGLNQEFHQKKVLTLIGLHKNKNNM